jgi:hypothetical protein
MAKKNSNVRLNKIPIDVLLEALMNLYESGVDYVDILGINNIDQDTIGLCVQKEYMSIDTEEDTTKKFNIKLSEEDLNQLL